MISVIIPTLNRADDLEKVLPSYLSQDGVLEVIIVDDSDKPDFRIRIQDLAKKDSHLVLVQDDDPRGLPGARNKGIRKAKGSFIFFGEDDLELAPGHLATLVSHLEKTKADIIEGRKIWKEPGESNEQALERAKRFRAPLWNLFSMEFNCSFCSEEDTPTPLLLSHFLAKKEVFGKVLFEEGYKGFRTGFPWYEETDFLFRAGQAGFQIYFCPHTIGFQHPTVGGGIHRHSFWQKEYWILKNHLFLSKRHHRFIQHKLKKPWPRFLLVAAFSFHRLKGQVRSKLYQFKKCFA